MKCMYLPAIIALLPIFWVNQLGEEGGLNLEDSPKNLEQAIQRRETQINEAIASLKSAEQSYLDAENDANKLFVETSKRFAKDAVALGDLPAARKCWEQVLIFSPQDRQAADFFLAIGQQAVVRRARQRNPESDRKIIGRLFRLDKDVRHRIENTRPGFWEEFTSEGKFTDYEELARDEYSVLLRKRDTGTRVRIHPTGYYWNNTSSEERGWVYGGDGKWSK